MGVVVVDNGNKEFNMEHEVTVVEPRVIVYLSPTNLLFILKKTKAGWK